MHQPPAATASQAILAVSRLLGDTAATTGPDSLRAALVREARALFAVDAALLLALDAREESLAVLALEPAAATLPAAVHPVADVPAIRDLLALRLPAAHGTLDGTQTGAGLPYEWPSGTTFFVPVRDRHAVRHVLALGSKRPRPFTTGEQELAEAFAAVAAGALAQLRLAEEQGRRVAQHVALARAARTLTENLDITRLLTDICAQSQAILEADCSAIYLGDADGAMVAEAVYDLDTRVVGYRMSSGEGLAGRVVETGRSQTADDYRGGLDHPPGSPFTEVQAALAVPMRWDGALRGVLSVGYRRPHTPGQEDVRLLETFAELAAAACRNANAATGLALAARTDALTGCLNHAALQEGLRREIQRAARSGKSLCLALLDLDGFKQVNETHGHLMGDEVLRRVGHALRTAVRPYDLCARYGGDEFAIVCPDADERETAIIADRVISRVAVALSDLDGAARTGATAGVSRWHPGRDATDLLEEADAALLYGKQRGRRGETTLGAELPSGRHPQPSERAAASTALHGRGPDAAPGVLHAQRQAERLQKRTRQLVMANALGARLAGMQDPEAIVNAAVEELHRAFGYYLCAAVQLRADHYVEAVALRGEAFVRLGELRWSQPRSAGIIGRAMRGREVVLVNDITADPSYESTSETQEVQAELVAPVVVGGRLWGVINVEENHREAFDDDDARLVQTVADQVGAALRSAELYEQLEQAYLGTAQALASAVQARDGEASTIVDVCTAVGERMGLEGAALRDLRYAAALHDIGRIAIPEAILEKAGPLDDDERALVERHPVVGERILAQVEYLSGVARLVRHARERWDGAGYPDGLAGPEIPLGARIVFACHAHHTMTVPRPHRPELGEEQARDELLRQAGTCFDPDVVAVLLAVLEPAPAAEALPAGS